MIRFRAFSTTTQNRPPVPSIKQLIASYPIRLYPAEIERRNYFDFPAPNASLFERLVSLPVRLLLARFAGKTFLNLCFKTDSGKPFYPRQFQKGVSQALPTLFDRLSGWDGTTTNSNMYNNNNLTKIMTPTLLDSFSKIHGLITESGHSISFRYDSFIAGSFLDTNTGAFPVAPDNIWITFGTFKNATSTLLRGPVVDRDDSVMFTRRIAASNTNRNNNTQGTHVWRDVCLECVYNDGGLGEDFEFIPPWQVPSVRLSDASMGRRVAVDSTVLASMLSFEVTRLEDGVVVESGDVDLAGMGIRMESSHFVGKEFPDNGVWKIADVDHYLISPRVVEEERKPVLTV
ncbi:hypothetical protein BDR26DRAFT_859563 [Obelidium mucronatum]|nr:hypothetical protein BDR26DRAFT_859563 [Obelidium mucronatum]